MDFNTMSDEQILHHIALNLEEMRIEKQISSEDMARKGGHNPQTFSNFINRGTNIRLGTLIQMFRGIGELDKLQNAFEYKKAFSPSGRYEKLPRRVWKKKTIQSEVKWGDDL